MKINRNCLLSSGQLREWRMNINGGVKMLDIFEQSTSVYVKLKNQTDQRLCVNQSFIRLQFGAVGSHFPHARYMVI